MAGIFHSGEIDLQTKVSIRSRFYVSFQVSQKNLGSRACTNSVYQVLPSIFRAPGNEANPVVESCCFKLLVGASLSEPHPSVTVLQDACVCLLAAIYRKLKKIRLEKKLSFKNISHKKQYELNEQVQDKVESAYTALELPALAVEKARTLTEVSMVGQWCWNMRCVGRQLWWWKTAVQGQSKSWKKPWTEKLQECKEEKSAVGWVEEATRAAWLGQVLMGGEPVQSNAPVLVGILPPVSKNAPQSSGGLGTSQLGPCYMCGKLGHYRKVCPLLLGTNSSKSMQ